MNASRSSVQNESKKSENDFSLGETQLSLDESVLQLIDHPLNVNVNVSNLRTDVKYKGFDSTMGDKWIYPTNYSMRQYQYHISRVSLFKNTLVVLPTGLGKTFIASVVMYNFFRWYPKGKIIFMAPTRPLVAQQIEACYQVMGFPKEETVELTGKQKKSMRAVAWREKRVFYCTPQIVWRDICDNEMNFPINDIKLVVVDEAHKAKGKYAYTEVVQAIWQHNKLFRVLALSATPGRTLSDVSEVVQNLLISHIEVRRENSIDVVPYVFKKNIKTVVVPLSEQITQIRQRLYELVEPYMQSLEKHQVITGQSSNMTKAWLLFDKNKFRESTVSNRHPDQTQINADFSVCIGMFHAIELLERHGMRAFLNYFNDNNNGTDTAEEKFFVWKDANIKQFITEVRQECGIVPFTDADMSFHGNISDVDIEESVDYGHPKFDILQNCLLTHFRDHSDSKAIVFCEYRDSVFLINRMLLVNRPLIRPKVFVGQGSSHNRTITQKEQIAIMNDFRSGKCNTLVATSVAEEGIDVGEVDFIVCFDVSNKNPIRFVQRIGRTGRKRQGKVAMLVTEGKEHKILRDVLATKDGINTKITKSNEINNVLYKECPRLVPPEHNPQCVETFIELPKTQAEPSTSKKKGTKATKSKDGKKSAKLNKKQTMAQKSDMRKFFKPIVVDAEIEEDFDLSDERSYLNTENFVGDTTADHSNDHMQSTMEEEDEESELLAHNEECQQMPNVSNAGSELDFDERRNLKIKLQGLYQRYCDAKKRAKWNELDEKVSKSSSSQDTRIPSPIRDMLKQHKSDANKDNWSNRSLNDKLSFMMLMSYLRLPQEQSRAMAKKSIISQAVNQFEDTQHSFVNTPMFEHESKYASQLKQSPKPVASIPQIFASSTPHKLLSNLQKPADPIHSPIVGISRINAVENHPNHPKPRLNRDDPKWYLKFLGLNSISDLFSDDENDENDEAMDIGVQNKSDDQETQLYNNLNKSICGNESFVEEQSQYTVSRILKICEDAERERGEMKPPNTNLVTPRRRRLYIGSVDDLFCDDDEDDGADDGDDGDNAIINSQFIDVALSSSNETINYDVDDAMSQQQKNAHQSTSILFKDSIEGETSHHAFSNAPVKTVANTKSDELFSTYNETVANSSKATANCTKNSTFNNQSPQREYNMAADESIPATPPKNNNSNFFAYFSRSPSVLIKASSILSANNHNTAGSLTSKTNDWSKNSSSSSSSHDDKSPSSLGFKLTQLNSQITLSKHFDDFDELKENFDIETNASQFATCPTARTSYHSRQRTSSTPDLSPDTFATCQSIQKINKKPGDKRKKARNRRKNHFIDDEAAVSGDDESDDDDFIATQGLFNVTEADEDDDPAVDMQAKYLQSVRSPIGQQRFRIGYRNTMATQDIFSQFVAPDQSKYEEDSFCVGSDEDSDCTQYSSESELSEFDEITIAETRPNKRKLDEMKTAEGKKRRRIIEMSSDSD